MSGHFQMVAVGTFMGIWASWRAAFRAPAGARTLLGIWVGLYGDLGTFKESWAQWNFCHEAQGGGTKSPPRRRRGVADAAAQLPFWTGKVPIAFILYAGPWPI